jgi:hypothetical protein
MGLFMTLFRSQPTVLYPPWNKSNDYVVAAAKTLNLQVRPDKISLSQYIKVRGDVKEDTVNFHYWAPGEQILIEPALAIYNRQRQKA